MVRSLKSLRISRPDRSSSIDYNEYILTPLEYLRLFITALLADMLVAYTFYQSRRVLLVTLPLCLLYPFSWLLTAAAEIVYFIFSYRQAIRIFHEREALAQL